MYFIHKDHIGSFNLVTNDQDTSKSYLSFDPWGKRRHPSNWNYNNVPTSYIFERGFTGHEHIDNFGLINMNGRMYDPGLGMMLGPDNFVSQPLNTQNYNRYSYALNNPLLYTDPTGWNPKPPPPDDDDDWYKRTGGGLRQYQSIFTNNTGRWYPGYSRNVGPIYGQDVILNSNNELVNIQSDSWGNPYYWDYVNSYYFEKSPAGIGFINQGIQSTGYKNYLDITTFFLNSSPSRETSPNLSDRTSKIDYLSYIASGTGLAANQTAKITYKYGRRINGVVKSAAQITRENAIIFGKMATRINVAGGVFGGIDCTLRAVDDFSNGNYALGAYETTKAAGYTVGTILLFTPAAPIGAGIVLVTGIVDIAGDIGLFYYGKNR